MFRSVKLELALPVVLPLLEPIRERVAALDAARNTPENRDDLQTLQELFGSDFLHTGVIRVDGDAAPAVLRACSLLRIELRQKNLSAIPEATLESGKNFLDDANVGAERPAVMCYWFLATLQESLLLHFAPHDSDFGLLVRSLNNGVARIGNFFRSQRASVAAAAPVSDQGWEVVVLNDPVNLMTYVTAAFQIVLGLPIAIARQRMSEVHEAKSSKVWSGSREKAEAYVFALQSWHLNAVLRSEDSAVRSRNTATL